MSAAKPDSRAAQFGVKEAEALLEKRGLWKALSRPPRIITDTTDFFRVDYGDVLVLGGRPFLVRSCEREGRFGIDDEPKYWVRRAIDLEDGSTKIIKMVFHERFDSTLGGFKFECVRSPAKEARILELTKDDPRFMKGYSVEDSEGNIIRIIETVHGCALPSHVYSMVMPHEEYFYSGLPGLLGEFMESARAIEALHDMGETHGDIRRDHIFIDMESGLWRWIDFDYGCFHRESLFAHDIAGLGHVLIFLVGRGDVTIQDIRRGGHPVCASIKRSDMGIVFGNRLVNLRKVYPYMPKSLNSILMHFSRGTPVFYESVSEMAAELRDALGEIRKGA